MSKPSGAQQCQLFGLPPRPVHSYQSPTRRRPHKSRSAKFHDKENRRSDFQIPRVQPSYHQPLADASNIMTSLYYNVSPSLAYPPPSKPSFVLYPVATQTPFAFSRQTLPLQGLGGAYAGMFRPSFHLAPSEAFQSVQVPLAECINPTSAIRDSNREAQATITPTTRRRLAVEGLRKAVSDAALRKMGIQGGFGWGHPVDQPIDLIAEAPNPIDVDAEKQATVEPIKPSPPPEVDVQPSSYSPRQYTPKPLLLPSKLARSNTTRSPPPFRGSLFSRSRTISYHRSRSPSETCCLVQTNDISLSEDNISLASETECATEEPGKPSEDYDTSIEKESTTPCDSSFASDHHVRFGSIASLPVDGGSTTPEGSSFTSDQMMESEPNQICHDISSCQVGQQAGISFDMSQTDEKKHAYPKVMTALMWTIAAPQKRLKGRGHSSALATNNLHRKSLGCLLGLNRSQDESIRHQRSSSETRISFESPAMHHPTSVELIYKSEMPTKGNALPDCAIAQPTFILPPPDTRKGVFADLRNLASPPSIWPPFIRRIPLFS